jgi:hypothetical protein
MMIWKGTDSALFAVTAVSGQTITYAAGDALKLNQTGGTNGTVASVVAAAPADPSPPSTVYTQTRVSRVRMISYYIDATTEPARPRLVRRLNNGNGPATGTAPAYNNTLGTAVAFDIENLQISYDLVDGVTNPANVKMNSTDMGTSGTGACGSQACNPNQIRKINITVTGRSRKVLKTTGQYVRNTLNTQVSLRSMAFVEKYK